MRLPDSEGSRKENEGAASFILRRTLEIGREGFLGLLCMAAVATALALVFLILELFANINASIFGS